MSPTCRQHCRHFWKDTPKPATGWLIVVNHQMSYLLTTTNKQPSEQTSTYHKPRSRREEYRCFHKEITTTRSIQQHYPSLFSDDKDVTAANDAAVAQQAATIDLIAASEGSAASSEACTTPQFTHIRPSHIMAIKCCHRPKHQHSS